MLFIISVLTAVIFLFLFRKPLKNHPLIFYIIAAALTAAASMVNARSLPPFVNQYIIGAISRGTLATAFWCAVMWAGALPDGSKLLKVLMPIRGELSIFAAFLTFGHVIALGGRYIIRFFTEAGKLPDDLFTSTLISLILVAIMVPLTVMSFKKVRKKMKASTWKKIQRTAYIFYALIYVHVLTFFIPKARMGREGYFLSIVAYSVVFISYAVFRIRKAYLRSCKRKKSMYNKKLVDGICGLSFAVLMCIPCLSACSEPEKKDDAPAQNAAVTTAVSETTVSETTEAVTEATSSEPVTSVSETTVSEVTDVSNTETEAVSDAVTASEEKKDPSGEEKKEEQPSEEPKQEEPQPEPEPENQYVYNNGTFTGTAYGYDGDITVTITIENDAITSISGSTAESDPAYFNDAKDHVFGQIMGTTNSQVSAYSGCTYSSNGIMGAVAAALDSARR